MYETIRQQVLWMWFSHIFPYFPIFSHMFPYVPIFSHMFPYFPICSHMFPYFPGFKRLNLSFRCCLAASNEQREAVHLGNWPGPGSDWYLGAGDVGMVIELDDGKKINRKALYLMVKTMVFCRFSLKPIHWDCFFWDWDEINVGNM